MVKVDFIWHSFTLQADNRIAPRRCCETFLFTKYRKFW